MTSGNVLNPDISFPHALLISASAGSGKTYTLAQRYAMFLLGEGRHKALPMNPENIIAVTFTNNAAKEMKQRILLYLKKLALGKNEDEKKISAALNIPPGELKRLASEKVSALLDSYSDFQVQTIDSFFSGIFRLSASELNYSPDIETRFSAESITDIGISSVIALAGRPGSILDEKGTDRFLSLIPKKKTFLWNPAEGMKEAFSDFLAMESSVPFSLAVPVCTENDTMDIFRKACEEYSHILKKVPLKYVREKLRDPAGIKTPADFIELFSGGKYSFFDGKYRAKINAEVPDADLLAERMNLHAKKVSESYSLSYYRTYMEIYGLFREKTEYAKRKITNSMPVSDISKRLADYISRSTVPEIYYNLGTRLSHFMIDEFQDTNRLQWNVMLPLIEEALSAGGSLFLVGDIKQAIYRFRHADYKIMSSLMENGGGAAHGLSSAMLPKGIECENLPVNYRSGGVITDYAEKVFKKELPGLLAHCGLEDRTGLTSYMQHAKPENRSKGYVLCKIVDPESEEGKNYKSIIIGWVKDAMARHSCSDIALLVNRNADVEEMAALLSSENIPSASYSSLDIRKRPIIAEIMSLLKFLDKPYDSLAFFSFINGSVFAKSAMPQDSRFYEELSSRDSRELLYVFFRNSAVFSECWEKYFDPLFRKSGYLPLSELICHIYDSFSVFDNFPEEQAALAKFQEAAASAAWRGINTIGAFLDYAAAEEPDEDSKKEFAVAMPDNMEAVQVMTWHKSKGLGFPVVINVITEKSRPGGQNIDFFSDGDKIYPIYNSSRLQNMSSYLRAKKNEDASEELMQSLNTMYVICTRAKQEMYNLVLRKKRKIGEKESARPISFADIFFPYEAGEVCRTEARQKKEHSLKAHSRKIERNIRFNAPEHLYGESDRTMQLRGELLHAVIAEYAQKKRDSGNLGRKNLLSDIYGGLYAFYFNEKGIISKDSDLKLIEKFLDYPSVKPFFAKNSNSETLYEAEFIDSDGNLIRIDLVKIMPECVIAADFKTGSRHAEKYRRQLLHYMKTLEQAYGRPAKGYVLYIDPPYVEEINPKQ